MASTRIRRSRQIDVQQTEFKITYERLLSEILNPGQIEPTDRWRCEDNGDGETLTIIRYRKSTQQFDENGDPVATSTSTPTRI